MIEYEKKGKSFFKDLDKKVREEGFALVRHPDGPDQEPEVMPLVDGNPTHIDQLEGMVEKGRFPRRSSKSSRKSRRSSGKKSTRFSGTEGPPKGGAAKRLRTWTASCS